MPKPKPATPAQVEAAVASLRSFWQTGRESWAVVESTRPGEEGGPAREEPKGKPTVEYIHGHKLDVLRAQAAAYHISHDTLSKAWRAGREYTGSQIAELCDLVVEYRARFGSTHLTRLLGVTDRRRRDALTHRAIKGRWGVDRLERAIQAARGRRPHVGRRPTVPDGQQELLAALTALADKWLRFCAVAVERLPADVREVAERAVIAVRKVGEAASGGLPLPEEKPGTRAPSGQRSSARPAASRPPRRARRA